VDRKGLKGVTHFADRDSSPYKGEESPSQCEMLSDRGFTHGKLRKTKKRTTVHEK
jgi:hypothetical protein